MSNQCEKNDSSHHKVPKKKFNKFILQYEYSFSHHKEWSQGGVAGVVTDFSSQYRVLKFFRVKILRVVITLILWTCNFVVLKTGTVRPVSVRGVAVSILAFQACVPGSTPGVYHISQEYFPSFLINPSGGRTVFTHIFLISFPISVLILCSIYIPVGSLRHTGPVRALTQKH
jgi:hypothetical protein